MTRCVPPKRDVSRHGRRAARARSGARRAAPVEIRFTIAEPVRYFGDSRAEYHGAREPRDAPVADRNVHVVIVFTDAGGGHRAVAEALAEILEGAGGYRVSLVNAYQEVLPHLDLFARFTPFSVEQVYNELIMRRGWTGLFCLGFYALAVMNVRLLAAAGRRAFAALWERRRPDLVISVLPLINPLMIDSLKSYRDGDVPFAVLMTDWAELTRSVWLPRRPDYHVICGTAPGYRQAVAKGHPPERLHRTAGLPVRPAFVDGRPGDVAAARRRLGLHPERPVVCVLYGGQGSRRMLVLAEALRGSDVQAIFLCGRDEALADALRAANLPYPAVIRGYTREVAAYFGVSDVFVGKPGPQSISEALAMGLPLLVDRSKVLPQERAVLRWLAESGAGQTFATPRQFRDALATCLAAGPRPRAGALNPSPNATPSEIPSVVRAILARAGSAVPTG